MKVTELHIPETPSTNALMKSYLLNQEITDFTVLFTDHQTKGRGQMGSSWESEKGKNIALSIYKKFSGVKISDQFIVSMTVSLALADVFEELLMPQIRIKWPNDIYSAHKKIAGILIETTMSGSQLSSAIIGIGINVNQQNFDQLPNASSMIAVLGKPTDLSFLRHLIVEKLTKRFDQLDKGYAFIQQQYESKLYQKDKVSLFKGSSIGTVNGIIKGVNEKGQLLVDIDQKGVMNFNLKEIQLLTSN